MEIFPNLPGFFADSLIFPGFPEPFSNSLIIPGSPGFPGCKTPCVIRIPKAAAAFHGFPSKSSHYFPWIFHPKAATAFHPKAAAAFHGFSIQKQALLPILFHTKSAAGFGWKIHGKLRLLLDGKSMESCGCFGMENPWKAAAAFGWEIHGKLRLLLDGKSIESCGCFGMENH